MKLNYSLLFRSMVLPMLSILIATPGQAEEQIQVQNQVRRSTSAKTITLAILAEESKADFTLKIEPLLQKEFLSCAHCAFVNLTPYQEGGQIDKAKMRNSIEEKMGKFNILYFNWNEKLSEENKSLGEFLQKISEEKILIVSSAGQPKAQESSAMLAKTLLGSVRKAIIIGEIGEKDRLIGQSFYGPEMLTALRPPKEYWGQGFAPLFFASQLTKNFSRREEWFHYLQEKKSNTRKVWLTLQDLFR